MAKRAPKKVNGDPVDFDETVEPVTVDVEIAPPVEPDLPVSDGIAEAEIAPAVDPDPPVEHVLSDPTGDVFPPETLEADEVISDEREHIIRVGVDAFHHVREARDGRWIYARVRPRG